MLLGRRSGCMKGERMKNESVRAGPSRCLVGRPSQWARDGKLMRCEKPADHDGPHAAWGGFIMFEWDHETPKLEVVR
jgi:hypothetical protein